MSMVKRKREPKRLGGGGGGGGGGRGVERDRYGGSEKRERLTD